jgi:hypothetical protein
MRALSAAASGVRHVAGVIAEAGLIVAIIGALAFGVVAFGRAPGGAAEVRAGNGSGGGGNSTATIAFAPSGGLAAAGTPTVGSKVSFAVTANVKASSVPYLWVANWCYQNGVAVYAQFLPVQNWTAGSFTLNWSGGTAACTAYVFLFPNTATPMSGGTMKYNVSG